MEKGKEKNDQLLLEERNGVLLDYNSIKKGERKKISEKSNVS